MAIELGLDYGGFVPKGRKAEDGPIGGEYAKLTELESESYSVRTERNAAEADGTIVFTVDTPTEGTAYTVDCLKRHGKQYLLVDFKETGDRAAVDMIRRWLRDIGPEILNVAGQRESKAPGIYGRVRAVLMEALKPVTAR